MIEHRHSKNRLFSFQKALESADPFFLLWNLLPSLWSLYIKYTLCSTYLVHFGKITSSLINFFLHFFLCFETSQILSVLHCLTSHSLVFTHLAAQRWAYWDPDTSLFQASRLFFAFLFYIIHQWHIKSCLLNLVDSFIPLHLWFGNCVTGPSKSSLAFLPASVFNVPSSVNIAVHLSASSNNKFHSLLHWILSCICLKTSVEHNIYLDYIKIIGTQWWWLLLLNFLPEKEIRSKRELLRWESFTRILFAYNFALRFTALSFLICSFSEFNF